MKSSMRAAFTVLFAIAIGAVTEMGAAEPAAAKEIIASATPSENRAYIRTDGLACYFCAYGLERFFKKTGRIASFDMHMKEGIVEVAMIEGKPLVSARDLSSYVHDSGFTPR